MLLSKAYALNKKAKCFQSSYGYFQLLLKNCNRSCDFQELNSFFTNLINE